MKRPMLSVVVTITGGTPHLERCLGALLRQSDPEVEILVPYFPWDSVEPAMHRFPGVRFLLVEGSKAIFAGDFGADHLGFDRRRAAGLAAAEGDIVAITEDHAIADAGWCQKILEAHNEPYEVIGGRILDAGGTMFDHALYYCDFGRYERRSGRSESLSDINVSYKRSALKSSRAIWFPLYHETWLHAALLRQGATLYCRPDLIVRHDRAATGIAPILKQRFAWARLYAGRRASTQGSLKRWFYALLSPALPFALWWRSFATPSFQGVLVATPIMMLLLIAWALGEWTGYVTGRPSSKRPDSSELAQTAALRNVLSRS